MPDELHQLSINYPSLMLGIIVGMVVMYAMCFAFSWLLESKDGKK